MLGSRFIAVAAATAFLTLGVSGPVGAAGAGARVTVDCSISGTVMTIKVNAKTKGGGKPKPVGSAGPVIIALQQKVGNQYSSVVGFKFTMAETGLPATAEFDMCGGAGSVSAGSRSVRGRGSAFIPGVGFVSGVCSPDKPPSCGG
jgi:hypothetical protein